MPRICIRLNPRSDPPILIAAAQNDRKTVDALINKGEGEQENEKGYNAIFVAAAAGHADLLSYLLDRIHLPDSCDSTGRTALLAATCNGHAECVYILLQKGADPLVADNRGVTPMHAIVIQPTSETVLHIADMLFDEEPELVNIATKDGHLPLHYAAAVDQIDFLDWLLDKRADVNETDEEGKTALHIACENGSSRFVVNLMELQSLDLNVRDSHGAPLFLPPR